MDHDASRQEAAAAVWRGTVRAVASGPTPDEAWALLGDFCSLHRWVSTVRACRRVEVEGAAAAEPEPEGRPAPGCVRYCEGPVNMAAPGELVGWSKERLLEMDHAGRWYSYELLESNKGFGRYRATVRVEHDPAGCAVRWSFEADPVKGWTLDGFLGFLEKLARGVAQRLQEEIMMIRPR
ncbi:Lachrymatory-factor synthase [Zea mays]|uniref:Lachrymatory-factor synthase n=1 Tax=Zea mays TaxID=4577 RepID=A0A1D6NDI1_MAIZE|nr:Lachrymatory-factor synthase [Zea mays]